MKNFFNKINKLILEKIKKKKVAISYSGGLDSNLLLNYYKKFKNKIKIIYINHNLNPDSLENKNKLKNKFKNIIIGNIIIKKKKIKSMGLEGAARFYRYKKITEICRKEKIKVVLLGHNFNDFIETFFINLLRGSSIYGLISMKNKFKIKNVYFIRPFIYKKRLSLIKKIGMPKFILKDKSNKNNNFLRNYLRNILLLISNKINYEKNIYKIVENIKNTFKISKCLYKIDKKKNFKMKKLRKMKKFRLLNFLNFFLKKKIFIPSRNWLLEIIKQIKSGKNFLIKKKAKCIFIHKNKLKIK
ncbi:tRNA lysidine(34) synthetase TilS [Candidatus Vidania fulgoroideorum]